MAEITFQKASLQLKKWRILLRGVSGSGKTRSALEIASQLGKKILVIDTEKASSTHNAKLFNFDLYDYSGKNHHPKNYVALIDAAQAQGYEVVIIDSFSHCWNGQGGILEIVDNLTVTKYKGNSYRAWAEGNQLYQELMQKIFYGNDMHIICTARTKQAYEITKDDRGKTQISKVGMETVQRDGTEYEFDISLDFSNSKPGYAQRDKDRTGLIPSEGVMVNKDFAQSLVSYLS